MARENQGLQIALIVCVMLTIILGVTTFVFYREYDGANTKANAFQKEAVDNSLLAKTKGDDNSRLKKVIGFAETDDMQTIDGKINEDMQNPFAAALPENTRVYRQVLDQLYKTLQEKSAALAASQAQLQKLEGDYKAREAGKDSQIKDFEKAAAEASQDRDGERSKFDSDRARLTGEQSDLMAQLQKSRKDSAAALVKVQGDFEESEKGRLKLDERYRQATENLEKLTKETFEKAAGEVTWADQHAGTVWVNLGRADALRRQVSFSVYGADASDVTKASKKGSIEVTQIDGEHSAQARIIDHEFANPIMPGDKVYTPLWAPGQQRHFALTGLMDVYGDGKNNQKVVHDLIVLNGGVVDCEADAKGEVQGQITLNTRYLVVGEEASLGTGKEVPQWVTANTTIRDEAAKYRLQIIKLADLLQQMGWKNQTSVVRYGRGADPRDFRAKPEAGASSVSGGTVSERFKSRTPPQPGPRGAY